MPKGFGRVAVAGLKSGDADPLDLKEDELRRWVGTRPAVKLIGDGSITSRLWRKPSISIIGLDATPVNWRFYVKHRILDALLKDGGAVPEGPAAITRAYASLRQRLPEL